MTPVTYTELRQNLAHWMDTAVKNAEPVLITRQGAKPVVMISLEEFEGWVETVHLLRSPKNAERLLASIAEFEAGKWEEHELILPPDDAAA